MITRRLSGLFPIPQFLLLTITLQGGAELSAQICPTEAADTVFTVRRWPIDPAKQAASESADEGPAWRFEPIPAAQDACPTTNLPTLLGGSCGGPLRFEIDRVVGLGRSGQDVVASGSAQGQLTNPGALVANGILGPQACASVFIGSSPIDAVFNAFGGVVTIYMNDRPIGQYTIPPVVYVAVTRNFRFDSAWLRYATRNENGYATPGVNRLTAKIQMSGGYRNQDVSVQLKAVSFKAVSPIVLVHGINGDSRFFGSNYIFNSGNPIRVGGIATYLAQNGFGYVFAGGKLPVRLFPPNIFALSDRSALTIGQGGYALLEELRKIGNSFGASQLNLMVHSKGGLWTRDVLRQLQEIYYFTELGFPQPLLRSLRRPLIKSVVTLDTPHHGAAGAVIGYNLLTIPTLAFLEANSLPRPNEVIDLSPNSVRGFGTRAGPIVRVANDRHSRPAAIKLFSVSGDSDVGQDRVIGDEESLNMPISFDPNRSLITAKISRASAALLYTFGSGDWSGTGGQLGTCDLGPGNLNWANLCTKFTFTVPTQMGQQTYTNVVIKNDNIVTRYSARYPQFTEIFGVSKNHATVAECARNREAIGFLLNADSAGIPSRALTLSCPPDGTP